MYILIVVAVIIVLAVLLLAVLTTSKAYSFKHTVDPIDHNPYVGQDAKEDQQNHNT
ncbi:YtzI protein [Neobacillus dielmonensis]|uniref:YtzI protein n=1 Tax=Neobacillus dielmonensis TaxID=1347369 RepID=UPI00094572E4|nr:YtzI protein [Neobacillus dielmonensis]